VILCQYLPTEKLQGASEGFTMVGTGQKYMVVDLGGTLNIRIIYIQPLFRRDHDRMVVGFTTIYTISTYNN
jgi:hypothetical protein